jgi:serine/threonine protein kinase
MTLQIGQQLGSYEIISLLGKGGMGEVYRARDLRLKREVAIKILPDEFSRDADRVNRFQREAEVLASLNHPKIAQIYGLEEANTTRCIVMELVEGNTLRDRLKRGPIYVEKALPIAKQIAEALEAAHERGVIHRDLKPANIKVTLDNSVKVLDFGLAKMWEQEPAEVNPSELPTVASDTIAGAMLGTPAYMSPEQARAEQPDRTADIWAFGCVLYEMLTGRQPFAGDTIKDMLGSILNVAPDWNALPKNTPMGIRRLLARCLQKDRKQRLHDMADARIEIEEVLSGAAVLLQPNRNSIETAWIVAAITVAIAVTGAAALLLYLGDKVPDVAEQRVEINTPPTTPGDLSSFSISPDGRELVFVATSQGRPRLWLRHLESVAVQPLPGTESAVLPFWSPNSRSIGFFADGKLKRVDISGGSPQTLCDAIYALGGTWNEDSTIVFTPAPGFPLHRVSDTGGDSMPITHLEAPGQNSHTYAQFLPDKHHFLFYVTGSPETRGVYVGSLESVETRRLFDADSAASFIPPNHVFFLQQGGLFTRLFDPRKLKLVGEAVPVAPEVGAFATSKSGMIAYRRIGPSNRPTELSWFDRSGNRIASLGALNGFSPKLSPDGTKLAMHRGINIDVWVWDLTRSLLSPIRFTTHPSAEGFPIWSPDGSRIAFNSNRENFELHLKSTTGSEETLWKSSQLLVPLDWSPDGRFILFRMDDKTTGRDLYVLPVTAEGRPENKPVPVANTSFEEREGQFSPDGHWIAFQSNETGRFEIYLQPFPGPGAKVLVSANGGIQPRWPRRDEKELFYIALDGKLMMTPVMFPARGHSVSVGTPSVLFGTDILLYSRNIGTLRQEYDVSPDGNRFLMNSGMEQQTVPITLLLNWKPPAK